MDETMEMNESSKINRVPLFDEYRLIERSENEINGAWKGAHLLLFFLAFVFGSFCTFCFHMLMYLFDEKCVLFPKLLSLTSLRHNVIYEFVPTSKDLGDMPVDFLSTQWVEKSTCSLPTYVPLVSGIFGLVWTTMFLMCSTGSRTLTGLQRPWRVLPPVFVFSLAMGTLCIYSSAVTHYGLQELCIKLGEITGSSTCTYTVNVATLTYERRIRGVYQATRLTILSAWMHTACWLLSALLALVRVLLAVDFQLVRVNVELHGDIDKILEKHEVQIRTFSPEIWVNNEFEFESVTKLTTEDDRREEKQQRPESSMLFFANTPYIHSELSLLPEERDRITRAEAYQTVPNDKLFIVKWLYDLVETLPLPDLSEGELTSLSGESRTSLARQYGQLGLKDLDMNASEGSPKSGSLGYADSSQLAKVDSLIIHELHKFRKGKYYNELKEVSSKASSMSADSVMNLTEDMKSVLEAVASLKDTEAKKSDIKEKPEMPERNQGQYTLKTVGVQTEKNKKNNRGRHVQISDKTDYFSSESDEEKGTSTKNHDVDKETQTREKEKQD